ncbi:MAG TPA: TlpA disulfide reductase family protein [Thermoanaerobaculia bacterium]|nr:TlpA disulfide reductase family protein [Thermoanaerobaculia bacterium]
MTRNAAIYLRLGIALLCLVALGAAAVAAPQPLRIGDPVPPFSLQTLDGKTLSIASLKGKVVLLDFWATWCGPCRQAMPELKALLQKNTGKPLVVVSVSADEDRKAPEAFARANGMTWIQAWDGQGRVIGGVFGASSLPSYVVIDADGRIAYLMKGWAPMSSSTLLSQAVSRALQTACTPSNSEKAC